MLHNQATEDNSQSKDTGTPLPRIAYAWGQTDAANAKRFIDRFHKELLFVPPWKKWLAWDGTRWVDDCGVGALQRAGRYSDSLWSYVAATAEHISQKERAKLVTFLKTSNQTPRIKAYMEKATVDERVVCPTEELNSDPTLVNCPNGTIELTTGKLRSHSPADRLTQLTKVPFDPKAECPKWLETLDLIFDNKPELIRYVQQLLGYSIAGQTGEHLLPIAFGDGVMANPRSGTRLWMCLETTPVSRTTSC